MAGSTRDQVLRVAMRLFGEHGYTATTIAQIEAEAGLSSGSGALYRHFRSKRDLVAAGIEEQFQGAADLQALLASDDSLAGLELPERLGVVFRSAIARLEHGQDLVRMLLREYRAFPDLMERLRDVQMMRVVETVAKWLAGQPELRDADQDWTATAGILVAAVSHYWFLRDSFGVQPFGVDEDRYLTVLTELTMRALVPVPAPRSTASKGD